MQPTAHVATSVALGGALYAASGSVPMAVSCVAAGVLIDVDHILDFCLLAGERFTVRRFFQWCNDLEWKRIFLFLHSYELFLVCTALVYIFPTPVAMGLLLGAGLHLALDQLFNREIRGDLMLSPYFYFLTYRFSKGFMRDAVCYRVKPSTPAQA